MPISEEVKEAVANQLRESLPLMDIDKVKNDFILWLGQMVFPGYGEVEKWEDWLMVFPDDEDNSKKLKTSGSKIRMSLKLYTCNNRYLITIIESFELKSRENYIITVNTGWKEHEKRLQKLLEEHYANGFTDSLRARHTIWAQTFKQDKLNRALNACATAILGNELSLNKSAEISGESIKSKYNEELALPEKK